MKVGSNVTPALAAEHGLTEEEFDRAVAILARTPNMTELGIFAAMWSEHCSYKSSKVWLKTLPTTGPRVICGPGENAGVIKDVYGVWELPVAILLPPIYALTLPILRVTLERWRVRRFPLHRRAFSAATVVQ